MHWPVLNKHETANSSCRCAYGSCSTAVASARLVWCAAHGTPSLQPTASGFFPPPRFFNFLTPPWPAINAEGDVPSRDPGWSGRHACSHAGTSPGSTTLACVSAPSIRSAQLWSRPYRGCWTTHAHAGPRPTGDSPLLAPSAAVASSDSRSTCGVGGEQNDHGDSRDRCRIVVRHRPRAQVYQVGGAATRYQVHATRHTRHTQPPMVC